MIWVVPSDLPPNVSVVQVTVGSLEASHNVSQQRRHVLNEDSALHRIEGAAESPFNKREITVEPNLIYASTLLYEKPEHGRFALEFDPKV